MNKILTYQRGLWLIDEIRLEPTGTETPTPRLPSNARRRMIGLGNPAIPSEWGSELTVPGGL